MSELTNGVDKIIVEVQKSLIEYTELSAQIEVEKEKTKVEFKKKYKDCLSAELESNIQKFSAAIATLQFEQTQASTSLQKRENVMCQSLNKALGIVVGADMIEKKYQAEYKANAELRKEIAELRRQNDEYSKQFPAIRLFSEEEVGTYECWAGSEGGEDITYFYLNGTKFAKFPDRSIHHEDADKLTTSDVGTWDPVGKKPEFDDMNNARHFGWLQSAGFNKKSKTI